VNAWNEDDWNLSQPSHDSSWFLFEPVEPPFPCTPPEAEIWLSLERQMWDYYVDASLTDEIKPLFLDSPERDDEEPAT